MFMKVFVIEEFGDFLKLKYIEVVKLEFGEGEVKKKKIYDSEFGCFWL